MYIGREGHLRGVRLFVGQRLHPDNRLAFMGNPDPPVNPVLAAGGNLHGLRLGVEDLQHASFGLENDLDFLPGLELVVDIGREHNLILLNEESRSLQPD